MKSVVLRHLARTAFFFLAYYGVFAQTEAPKDTMAFKYYGKDQRFKVPLHSEKIEGLLGEGFDASLKKHDKVWSQSPSETAVSDYVLTSYNLDDELLLHAHAGLFSALGVTPQKTKRYCVVAMYRANKTKDVFSGAPYTGQAKLVAGKIVYGNMVTVLLEGDSARLYDKTFLRLLKPEVDILKEAARRGLTAKVLWRGVQPQSKGVLPVCSNNEIFGRRFQTSNAEPLFVEYTVLNEFASPKIHFADIRIQPGEWIVSAVRVEVETRKPNNNSWDPLFGKPDLVVSLELGKSVYATSKMFKNTLSADWKNINTPMTLNKGQIFQLSVVDKDPEGDDYVGTISIDTDTLFKFEPEQLIFLPLKDEKSGIKQASVLFERSRK